MNSRTLKIILGGESGTGKTSFIKRYLKNEFSLIEQSTIDSEFYTIKKQHDESELLIQISDLGGSPQFRFLQDVHVKGAVAALLFFSNRDSFEKLPEWIEFIKKNSGTSKTRIFIIRSKIDLEVQDVSNEKIKALVEKHGLSGSFHISSKTGANVKSVMDAILQAILRPQHDKVEDKPVKILEKIEVKEIKTEPQPSSRSKIATEEVKVKIGGISKEAEKIKPETTVEDAVYEERFDPFVFLEETRRSMRSFLFLNFQA
ncbi:MAG: Rab family GTPase, partial [Candidatus Helarchaeales archaeon]